ncbi:SCO family protein [bacterium]|nr:SCO family protein [bacterium]
MNIKHIFLIMISAVLVGVSFFAYKEFSKPAKELPVLGTVPNFQLYNTSGSEFTNKNLENKVWVVDFIFTTCQGICLPMTEKMAFLHRAYTLEENVAMVSVSVNPETDSPEVLAEFAKTHKADTETWHFLTGSVDEIKRVTVEGFKIGSAENPVFHSDKFVLVDKKGQIRGFYTGTDQKEVDVLFGDISVLLKEN